MDTEMKFDSLGTIWRGREIHVEACQPVGGKAVVTYVELGQPPAVDYPGCGEYDTMVDALEAGLRWAIQQLSYRRAS